MNLTFKQPQPRQGEEALTLIEMMVSTTCLLIIVLGLTAMFMQTQKAFKLGVKQNDVFDGGRAIADLLARDLAQVSDAQSTNVTDCFFDVRPGLSPVIQNIVNSSNPRTNLLGDVYLITRVGSSWAAVGYAILPSVSSNIGVGALYRFVSPTFDRFPTNSPPPVRTECVAALSNQFMSFFGTTNWMTNRVADGIIHLQVRAFGMNGDEILQQYSQVGGISLSNLTFPILTNDASLVKKIGTNLPASLELELGILEPETLEHLRALGNSTAQLNYLADRAGQVQIFRQQIPIKGVIR